MACIIASMATYAQTSTDAETDFKPQAKKVSAELNVNPFNGNINLNNSLNQVKLRYFIKPQLALRVGFNVNRRDTITNVNNPYGVNSYFYKDDKKSTLLGLNLGIEKHFTGTKRLSPYVAVEAAISNRTSKETSDNNGSTTTSKNGWYSYSTTIINGNSYYTTTQVQQVAYFRYGVNLAAGFDYYMAKHLFFGYEFNLGISKTNWKNVEVTQTGQPNNANNYVGSGKNSSLNFGTTLLNGIRVGYTF
jgi:hypothetical protein